MRPDPTPRLRAWIIAQLYDGRPPADFADDTDLIADGVMDSLGIMQLLTHLETEHGVTVAVGDIVPERFQSVRVIADWIGAGLDGGLDGAPDAPDAAALEARGRALIAALPHLTAYAAADYVLAPYLNATLRPGLDTGIIRADASGFRVSHDALGLVDSESWFARPRRALLLGNSFALGWGASGDDQTLASHLNRRTPYSFLNLGLTGASSLQETIAAIPFLAHAELVLVISGIGNLMHYCEYDRDYDLYGAFFPQQLYRGIGQTRIDHLSQVLERRPADGGDTTTARAADDLARELARHAKRIPDWSAAARRERRDLALAHHARDLRLLSRARSPGARIVYAMQPTSCLAKPALEPDEQALLAAFRQYPMWRDVFEPAVRDQLDDYIAGVRGNCDALGVPFVDLNAIDYQGVCFIDYGHTTDLANAHIADYLADYLAADLAAGSPT